MKSILPHLRRAAVMGLSDRELLDALVARRDETAFEALLRRHGPMVLAVCQRVLRNAHDAEDAFQASFLVLVRKASAIREKDILASWLYGVAYRTAQKARAMNARRRCKEEQTAGVSWRREARLAVDLDDELSALPEKYRVPVVLCQLEGRSRREVARQLNIAEGTLSSRLATARKTLAEQLRRHGWSGAPAVGVPPSLLASTARAAALLLAGRADTGLVSAHVLALTEGVIKIMFLNPLKAKLAFVLVVLGTLGMGTTWFAYRASADGPTRAQEPPAREDRRHDTEADLDAARFSLKQAEADLAAAEVQLAQRKAAYQQALARTQQPGDTAELKAAAKGMISRFKYRVPIEIGHTESDRGGRLEILEVWGTRPKIQVGGQYLVRGKYVLPSRERGKLYFFETTDGQNGTAPNFDLQTTEVEPGKGEFTLLHGMGAPGYFHLILTGQKYSNTFANVYFGTGDNVWRK